LDNNKTFTTITLAHMSDIKYTYEVDVEVFFVSKMGRPPAEQPKTNKVTIRMTEDDYAWLMKYNQTHNQTITETMSEALKDFIKKDKRKQK